MIRLQGITWDHRRATDPLRALDAAFRRERPGVEINWRTRPLSGFEFDPIEKLADENDLIVFDHPFCGRIAASGCLVPADDALAAAGGESAFVGLSAATYRYGGRIWAVPIDAACQVAACRPDLMARIDAELPRSWPEVCALAKRSARGGLSVVIGLRGVHALMTFFSLSASLGHPYASNAGGVDETAADEALAEMSRLVSFCRAPVLDLNSIQTHEALSRSDELAYCPAVYGFAAYGEADRKGRLSFGPFPSAGAGRSPAGSTIGGAGLGLSARLREDTERLEAALAYARLAASGSTQRDVFAPHHGQPAHVAAWDDPQIDRRFNGFFSATRETIERSWVRPRYNGYLAFQAQAGDLIEAHLRGELARRPLLDRLKELDARCRTGRQVAR